MPKRFGRLEYALELLRNPKSTSTQNPTPPAQSALDEYLKWRSHAKKQTITRTPDMNPKGYDDVYIKPFMDASTLDPMYVTMSKRASTDKPSTLNFATDFNHISSPTNTRTDTGFDPAKAIFFAGAGGTVAKDSGITNIPYKKRTGKSFTIPFGQETGGSTFRDTVEGIISKTESIDFAGVSIKNEKLSRA